jgi:hypothetical protein
MVGAIRRPPGDGPRASTALGPIAALALIGSLVLAGPAAALEQTLTPAGGAAGDVAGTSVAIDGDFAVVGARLANGFRGAAYVFKRSGDSWVNTATLNASDGQPGDELGDTVAIAGEQIVVGAPFDDIGASAWQGSVYTFSATGAAVRTETAKLTASDGAQDDKLGWSVAISGDLIVAGAPADNTNRGSAYTFAATGPAARTETAKLTASDGAATDNFGISVATSGSQIAVGASEDDVTFPDQGSAYTFAATGGSRTETAKLTASDGDKDDELGTSVGISNSQIVAGSPNDTVGVNANQGSAYTFATTGGSRTETAKLTASDGAQDDFLGFTVGISETQIVAGATVDDVGANTNQGSAYIFDPAGAVARTETARLTASDGAADDRFGGSVAVSGDEVIAGSRLDDVGANVDQGSATVFYPPTPTPPPTPPDTVPPETKFGHMPKSELDGTTATYRFSSTEAGSTFECKLDKGRFKPCTSPKRLRHLKPGKHRFSVAAIDSSGNRDPTPSKDGFRVR